MSNADATKYSANGAIVNYLGQYRSDIQFAVQALCNNMGNPEESDMLALKRLARYLVGVPRVVIRREYQESSGVVEGWPDTDHAGCKDSRMSTSGGLIMLGSHLINIVEFGQPKDYVVVG